MGIVKGRLTVEGRAGGMGAAGGTAGGMGIVGGTDCLTRVVCLAGNGRSVSGEAKLEGMGPADSLGPGCWAVLCLAMPGALGLEGTSRLCCSAVLEGTIRHGISASSVGVSGMLGHFPAGVWGSGACSSAWRCCLRCQYSDRLKGRGLASWGPVLALHSAFEELETPSLWGLVTLRLGSGVCDWSQFPEAKDISPLLEQRAKPGCPMGLGGAESGSAESGFPTLNITLGSTTLARDFL